MRTQEEQSPVDGSALCEIINNMGGISRKRQANRDSQGGGKG